MEQFKKRKILLLTLLAVMFIAFTIKSPYFLKIDNLMSIGREGSTVGILALGMTLVIIAGGIDLSIGSIIAFSAMLCLGIYSKNPRFPAGLMALIVLAIGVAIGLLNGMLITKLKVPDFIVTLSTQTIFRGLTTIIAPKDAFGNILNININNKSFSAIAGKVGPVHNVIIAFAFLSVFTYFLLRHTRQGTCVYAVGAHQRSARLSGIDVDRTKIFTYMYSGLMAGIAALFMCARIRTGTADLADSYETEVIAATIVGGTAFSGGRGDIPGTVIGAIFLATLQNGIYKFNISTSFDPIILGTVIIISIMFDEVSRRISAVRASKRD